MSEFRHLAFYSEHFVQKANKFGKLPSLWWMLRQQDGDKKKFGKRWVKSYLFDMKM
jgi:hypothetical protein